MAFDILSFVDKLEPRIKRGFLDSIYDIQSEANLTRITAAIADGAFEDVFRYLNLEPAMFSPYREAFRSAYAEVGMASVAALPALPDPIRGGPAVARFDVSNPRAEAWVRTQSSFLITEVVNETKEAVRVLLTHATERGIGPRTAALDLIGRYDARLKRRVGGVVGIHSQQARYVTNALDELTSGDPARMANYLTRKRRDRRFDGIVRKALRDGRPLSREQAGKLTARYSDRLVQLRGETIARTEMLQGAHNAQDEGLNQLVEDGKLNRESIKATWDAANDADTRDSHAAMDGQKPDENGIFTTGAGYKLRYPGDRSLGAPAEEIINCRCRKVIDLDFTMELRNG